MKLYKVVVKDRFYGYTLTSCCQNLEFPESIRVIYKVGEYVEPVLKGSLLFAFKSLDEAKRFKDSQFRNDGIVYECDGVGVTKVCYPQLFYNIYSYWETFSNCRRLKKKIDIGNPLNFVNNYTSGVCCQKIKLLKKVY